MTIHFKNIFIIPWDTVGVWNLGTQHLGSNNISGIYTLDELFDLCFVLLISLCCCIKLYGIYIRIFRMVYSSKYHTTINY